MHLTFNGPSQNIHFSFIFCLSAPPPPHLLGHALDYPYVEKIANTLFHASRWIMSSLGPQADTLLSYFHILQLWQLESMSHLWKLNTWKREILVDSTHTQPRGLFVHFSRLIESLSHYAAASAQVCNHRARPFSNLSIFSPSVKFSLSDDESSLDTSYLHLESSLIVKLAQEITWSEHFTPRCVFSNLSNFDRWAFLLIFEAQSNSKGILFQWIVS